MTQGQCQEEAEYCLETIAKMRVAFTNVVFNYYNGTLCYLEAHTY